MKKTPKKNKTMRNAFIRVSAKNILHEDNDKLGLKAGDVVEYTLEDILDILDDWNRTKHFSYYMIEHNEDEENRHFHIVISFDSKSSCQFNTLKAKFPYGNIDSCRHGVHACARYLIHADVDADNPEKKKYNWNEVYTNNPGKLERYKEPTKYSEQQYVNKLVEKICNGELREYEITEKIEPAIYIKYHSTFKNAFEFRTKMILNNPERDIMICVLQGESRVGKSTFVKNYAKINGLSLCMSSSSNDSWESYRGHDIYCYDDFNYEKTKIEDFLKALDPYNNTSVQSRYHNRVFIGSIIFICTNESITKWYQTEANDSHRAALFKRISCVLDFTKYDEEENKSYYTVNRIVPDTGYDAVTDNRGIVLHSYKEWKLERIDDEVREFDLNKYIDITQNETKKEEFLKNISKL